MVPFRTMIVVCSSSPRWGYSRLPSPRKSHGSMPKQISTFVHFRTWGDGELQPCAEPSGIRVRDHGHRTRRVDNRRIVPDGGRQARLAEVLYRTFLRRINKVCSSTARYNATDQLQSIKLPMRVGDASCVPVDLLQGVRKKDCWVDVTRTKEMPIWPWIVLPLSIPRLTAILHQDSTWRSARRSDELVDQSILCPRAQRIPKIHI